MNREQAKAAVKERVRCTEYLQKSKSGLYCCPLCGSGTGQHSTGAVKYYPDTNTWHCFSCNTTGDPIDLYRQTTGADYSTALSLLAESIGITIDPYRPTAAEDFSGRPKNDPPGGRTSDFQQQPHAGALPAEKSAQEAVKRPTEATPDFTDYYRACRERLNDPAAAAYLKRRGISLETAAAYWIGFDPAADPAGAPGAMVEEPKAHPCPRLIIPTSTGHYIGRSTDPATPSSFAKLNNKGGNPAIFNERVLYAPDVQEVFVTEGAFDALSILEAGAPAIALNSTSNAAALLKKLEERPTAATLILALDNDEAGKKATETIREGLQRLNIAYTIGNITAGQKDPNAALTADRPAFLEAVREAQRQAGARPDNTSFYLDALMTEDVERFRQDKRTGFANLDEKAGGLYSGLYVLAAISSLGKTSFALQLADQLAESGQDVIFFSMEQSRLELVSKSLARRTAQADPENAVSSLSIRKGYFPRQVLQAKDAYKAAVADRLSIVEGNFSCDISFIGDYVRRYIARNKTRPVVFIDYLQILQPAEDDKRRTTRETVDIAVTELKRLSRAEGLTVIVISSVNRINYLTPIDFESLKESGGIEFTADVVWGLQLAVIHDELFNGDPKTKVKEKRERVKQAKAENPRKIELCCLKNRYGIANYSCYFRYFPANDLFTEESAAAADFSTGEAPPEWMKGETKWQKR